MHAFERAFVSAIVALALGSLDVEAQQPPPGPDVAANPDGGMAPLSPEQQAYVEQLIEKQVDFSVILAKKLPRQLLQPKLKSLHKEPLSTLV